MWSTKAFWNFKQIWKIICKYFDSKYEDYRDFKRKEKIDYNNKNLTCYHFTNLDLHKAQMVFDARYLYPSAMWDKNSLYPEKESGVAFKQDMNDVFEEAFNNQTFNQIVSQSAILGIKFFNQSNFIFQHLPVNGKVENKEVIRLRNGYIIDTLKCFDIQKCQNSWKTDWNLRRRYLSRKLQDDAFQKGHRKTVYFKIKARTGKDWFNARVTKIKYELFILSSITQRV